MTKLFACYRSCKTPHGGGTPDVYSDLSFEIGESKEEVEERILAQLRESHPLPAWNWHYAETKEADPTQLLDLLQKCGQQGGVVQSGTGASQLVKHLYSISNWRFDIPRRPYGTREFEGESVEACDAEARKWFLAQSDLETNQWDGMDLERIDAPPVAEKRTFLLSNGRQEHHE